MEELNEVSFLFALSFSVDLFLLHLDHFFFLPNMEFCRRIEKATASRSGSPRSRSAVQVVWGFREA